MLNKFKQLNKIQKASLIALAVILVCQLGGFTGAWFTSHDAVTNVFGMYDYFVDIVLLEPNWESVGFAQAHKMQPGMDIFKDPRVQNLTEDSCYVRMQIVIADKDGNVIDDLISNATSSTEKTALENKKTAILAAISYCTDDNDTAQVDDDSFVSYYNGVLNPRFSLYDDGWFYYTDGDGNCTALEQADITEPLFTDVRIPNLKADYGYFANGFVISVRAEAVTTAGIPVATVENVASRFAGSSDEDDTTTDSTDNSDKGDTTTDSTDSSDKGDTTTDSAGSSDKGDTATDGTVMYAISNDSFGEAAQTEADESKTDEVTSDKSDESKTSATASATAVRKLSKLVSVDDTDIILSGSAVEAEVE
jgi:hypothetical protein